MKNLLSLELDPISRTRRNHGLEHATLHILGKKHQGVPMGGISTPSGFMIVGNVSTEDVAEAAIEALLKLRAGETHLATHPYCGTNFAFSGLIAGMAAWVGTIGAGKAFKNKLQRLPVMIVLATLALIFTRPLGPMIQQHITTSSDPEGLELERVETVIRAGMRMHRVITRH